LARWQACRKYGLNFCDDFELSDPHYSRFIQEN